MRSLNATPGQVLSPATNENAAPPALLTRSLLLTMAAACGLAVANLYYNQPLLPQIARYFHVSDRQVGVLPMLTQAGFALGVFLLAPLGDTVERRRLILIMLALVTVSLVLAALSPNFLCLAIASLAIGITSVISTQVLPQGNRIRKLLAARSQG